MICVSGEERPLSPPRYDHVIWDWNGTLLDDVELVVDIMNGLLAPRRLPSLDVGRYHEVFTFPVADYYARLGFDLVAEPFEELAIEFMSGYLSRWPEAMLRSGALDALERVAGRGVGQSMLSAAERSLLEEATTHFGVAAFMSHRVGIDDHHAVSKLEHGRAHLADLDADRVLLVGDTEHDAEVAAELGIECALIEGGHMSGARLRATGLPVYATLGALFDELGGVAQAEPAASR